MGSIESDDELRVRWRQVSAVLSPTNFADDESKVQVLIDRLSELLVSSVGRSNIVIELQHDLARLTSVMHALYEIAAGISCRTAVGPLDLRRNKEWTGGHELWGFVRALRDHDALRKAIIERLLSGKHVLRTATSLQPKQLAAEVLFGPWGGCLGSREHTRVLAWMVATGATETAATADHVMFMRQDSLFTRLLYAYMTTGPGQAMLRHGFGSLIQDAIDSGAVARFASITMASEDEQLVLVSQLASLVRRMFDSILASFSGPGSFGVRLLGTALVNAVTQRWPKLESAASDLVGGMLFLRVLSPAISAPDVFGLYRVRSANADRLSPQQMQAEASALLGTLDINFRKGLMTVSRILQCLANGTDVNGSTPSFAPLNALVHEFKPRLHDTLAHAFSLAVPLDAYASNTMVPESVSLCRLTPDSVDVLRLVRHEFIDLIVAEIPDKQLADEIRQADEAIFDAAQYKGDIFAAERSKPKGTHPEPPPSIRHKDGKTTMPGKSRQPPQSSTAAAAAAPAAAVQDTKLDESAGRARPPPLHSHASDDEEVADVHIGRGTQYLFFENPDAEHDQQQQQQQQQGHAVIPDRALDRRIKTRIQAIARAAAVMPELLVHSKWPFGIPVRDEEAARELAGMLPNGFTDAQFAVLLREIEGEMQLHRQHTGDADVLLSVLQLADAKLTRCQDAAEEEFTALQVWVQQLTDEIAASRVEHEESTDALELQGVLSKRKRCPDQRLHIVLTPPHGLLRVAIGGEVVGEHELSQWLIDAIECPILSLEHFDINMPRFIPWLINATAALK